MRKGNTPSPLYRTSFKVMKLFSWNLCRALGGQTNEGYVRCFSGKLKSSWEASELIPPQRRSSEPVAQSWFYPATENDPDIHDKDDEVLILRRYLRTSRMSQMMKQSSIQLPLPVSQSLTMLLLEILWG